MIDLRLYEHIKSLLRSGQIYKAITVGENRVIEKNIIILDKLLRVKKKLFDLMVCYLKFEKVDPLLIEKKSV